MRKKKKDEKTMHVNSSVQRPASSATHHTSFIYFRMQSKTHRKVRHNLDSLQVKESKHVPRADALKSGTEQGSTLPLSCPAVLGLF